MKPILLALIAAILLGDIGALAAIGTGDDPPSKWDARVVDLARFVEDERRLRFDHPVDVRFLTEDEYEDETSGDSSALTDEDKQEIANIEGELRALGLIKSGVSLFDDQNALISGGTLAFYDPDAKEMVIRGTEITIGLKVTIVHELTHALQDQHFDLGQTFESDNRDIFFQALGEGDATRIENAYIDSLSEKDANAYFDEADAASENASEAIDDVSPALTQLFAAPYELGEPLTSIVVDSKGVADLNALFRDPPASDEGLMNPFALLEGAKPVAVARPKARSGEKITDGGDFGGLTWYLVLASFIDAKVALNATDGWGGDSFIGYRKNGRSCVRAHFVGDTPQDNQEMGAALDQWRRAFQSNAASIEVTAKRVVLDSCETTDAPAPLAGSDQALVLPIIRYQIAREVLAGGGSQKLAKCAVREYFARFSFEELTPESEAEAERLVTGGQQIGRDCAARGET
ncbi:MAG: hypothetical protein Q8K63_04545 [Acidimicrobiales bacterium]|nr:hypothetical protein [Acidimicrobiales bacterium]